MMETRDRQGHHPYKVDLVTSEERRSQHEIEDKEELMGVRAKFKCMDKSKPDGEGCSTIRLEPVYCGSEENKQFFRWTPGGQISLSIINPSAAEQFEVGKEYYVDFTAAPETTVSKEGVS